MKVLVINPGSTSTKVALFHRDSELWRKNLAHPVEERFPTLDAQLAMRRETVLRALREEPGFAPPAAGSTPSEIGAVIGRGGLLHPLAGGVYRVNQAMKEDLSTCRYGTHASNLGGLLADMLAVELGVPAFIADPVVVDELDELARYSGLPDIPRRSIFHALNQKACARRAARELGKRYEECALIVAHLDGRRCLEVVRAMCYRVAKEICSLAAAAAGRLDAVVLTGGLARSGRIVEEIAARVKFLAPLFVYPGENEMEALAAAAYEALDGRQPIQEYRR
jgi:butyrate kinase